MSKTLINRTKYIFSIQSSAFLRRPQKFWQSVLWFWRLLSKCQNHKAHYPNFFGLLRKAELYNIRYSKKEGDISYLNIDYWNWNLKLHNPNNIECLYSILAILPISPMLFFLSFFSSTEDTVFLTRRKALPICIWNRENPHRPYGNHRATA